MNMVSVFQQTDKSTKLFICLQTLHIVGSDEFEENFRVLEISRNDRKELVILDDYVSFTIYSCLYSNFESF